MIINITEQDIQRGCINPLSCPIKNALNRLFVDRNKPFSANIQYDCIIILLEDYSRIIAKIPNRDIIRHLIRKFDQDRINVYAGRKELDVAPCSIDIPTLEDYV